MKTNYEKLMKINYEKLLIFYLPFTNSTATDKSPPFTLMADLPLSKGVPEGRGIKVPPSPTLLGHTLAVASRHCEEERRSDPFMIDLR